MYNLIVCQLLGILCIVALILVFIIQGFLGVCIRVTLGCQSGCIRVCPCINILLFFPAVRAVLLRTVSCRVMVEDRVVLTVSIQVQSIPVISVFLCKSGNDRIIISCPEVNDTRTFSKASHRTISATLVLHFSNSYSILSAG